MAKWQSQSDHKIKVSHKNYSSLISQSPQIDPSFTASISVWISSLTMNGSFNLTVMWQNHLTAHTVMEKYLIHISHTILLPNLSARLIRLPS